MRGQWTHVETWDRPPTHNDIAQHYGSGEFSVAVAEDGTPGLRHFDSHIIKPVFDYVGWISAADPRARDLQRFIDSLGPGYYYVGSYNHVRPVVSVGHAFVQPDQATAQQLNGGAMAMNGYVIYKVISGLPGGLKTCPHCHSFYTLDAEMCSTRGCGFNFVVAAQEIKRPYGVV